MTLVNFRKNVWLFSFDFRQNFDVRTFPRWLSIRGTKFLLRDIRKIFFQTLHLVLLYRFLEGFSKFGFFIGEICILIWDFWVIFKNYSMCMLSIRGNNFIACWAYTEPISSHAEHTRNEFPRLFSQRYNVNFLHVQSMLSIRGMNFITHWAYAELISSHAEHTGNRFHRMLSMRGNV